MSNHLMACTVGVVCSVQRLLCDLIIMRGTKVLVWWWLLAL
jgi:hypothetical protein